MSKKAKKRAAEQARLAAVEAAAAERAAQKAAAQKEAEDQRAIAASPHKFPPIDHATAGPRSAEQYVAVVLRTVLGANKVKVTSGGRDEGIDVVSRGFSVQVKRYANQAIGRPDIQRLNGARRPGTEGLFFTSSRYTKEAIAYAGANGIALFTFDFDGVVPPRGVNKRAKTLLNGTDQRTAAARRYGDALSYLRMMSNDSTLPDETRAAARELAAFLAPLRRPDGEGPSAR
nr:restriction endonuclease [Nocardioides sp. zg-DK7169]